MITLNELIRKFAHAGFIFDQVLSGGAKAQLEGDCDDTKKGHRPKRFKLLIDDTEIEGFVPTMRDAGSLQAEEFSISLASHVLLSAEEKEADEKGRDRRSLIINFKKGLMRRGTHIELAAKFRRAEDAPEGVALLHDAMNKNLAEKIGEKGL